MSVAVVTTTIGLPKCLPSVFETSQLQDTHFYVVCDNKTPTQKVSKFLSEKIPDERFTVVTMPMQRDWLKSNYGDKAPRYAKVFQENNYQRRIIGFLMAKQSGHSAIVALDDDNYPSEGSGLVDEHIGKLGKRKSDHIVASLNSYVNFVDFLNIVPKKSRVYVRGYPLYLGEGGEYVISKGDVDVAVNIGTWSGDPDVSALTRVTEGTIKSGVKPDMENYVLHDGSYTSMCLQNISFDMDYLVTQYEFPMNVPMNGLKLGRYDDIWAGYICKKILDSMGKHMSFGTPMAIHDRNLHYAMKDFLGEFWGLHINDSFYKTIRELDLPKSSDVHYLFNELVYMMGNELKFNNWEIQKYFNRVWEDMRMWGEMVETLK